MFKLYKQITWATARHEWDQLRKRNPDLEYRPLYRRGTTKVTFHFRDARRMQSDPGHLAAWIKPVWDGIQEAGIIENDRQLTHMPIEMKKTHLKKNVVEIQINLL